jgi:DNA helicase-4
MNSEALEKEKIRKRKRDRLKKIIIGFLIYRGVEKRIIKCEEQQKTLLRQIEIDLEEIEQIKNNTSDRFEKLHKYLLNEEKNNFLKTIRLHKQNLTELRKYNFFDNSFISNKIARLNECILILDIYNDKFLEKEKINYSNLFDFGVELDDEQKNASIVDDKYNLIVAGAGSGKTEVLITRIAYLTIRTHETVKPERILALAFQNKAAREIEKRLVTRYGLSSISVSTFHKLGKDIIEESGREIAGIVDDNKFEKMVLEIFKKSNGA